MKAALLLAFSWIAATAAASSFRQEVTAHFHSWDADHDGVLSVAEIERGVASDRVKGPAAAAIASLRRAVRTPSFKLPPLTLEAIQKLVPKLPDRDDLPDLDGLFADALERLRSSSPELLVPAKLDLDCLEQGKLGDCFCLAPMGAMLHRHPAAVARMFGQGNDGLVSVTLGGGRVFRVPFPTDAERALMATTDGSGVWVNCYEKAVGRLKMNKDHPDHLTELNVVTRGGSAGTMLSILTGHEIVRASCLPFRDKKTAASDKLRLLEDIRRQMVATQAAGRLICGGTASGKTTEGHRPPGIRGPHAYAILHYDAPTDVVTLWDPHGDDFQPESQSPGVQNGYSRTQGRLNVPLTELVQWFGGFSFETDRPLKAG